MIPNCIYALLGLALHELGHVAMCRFRGLKVRRLIVNWKGVGVVREAGTKTDSLLIALSGPALNLILAAAFWHSAHGFAWCNFVLGTVNLLPFPGFDGKNAVNALKY